MDVPSAEHSDSDSGESWTLLENNSVYADEPPEFIEEPEKHGAQHHDKDEDTDGISIISDSDHETPSPIPGETIYEKCQTPENQVPQKDIIDSVDPCLPPINDDDNDCEPAINEDFLGDSHAKHKTYVHRRNKRLSTVLNIIVLGSVITAAGVAIGHMWGAKNDCTLQTTSSVNKILSNLYKLQEENAYLRGKLIELTHGNSQLHHKIPPRNIKCRKVFEESLSNYEPQKLTKCVDENYKNSNNVIEHKMKQPKFEKEFIADIDKLKTVYLQNKSWLDDEISRRMKIEKELLKKYKYEVNSGKDQNKDHLDVNNEEGHLKDAQINKEQSHIANTKMSETDIPIQVKFMYADSVKTAQKPRFKRDEERYGTNEDKDWLSTKQFPNFIDQEFKAELNEDHSSSNDNYPPNSIEVGNSNHIVQNTIHNDWTEAKPKFRRNEERYENDYDNSVLTQRQKTDNYRKEQQIKHDERLEAKPQSRRNEERYETEDDSWLKNAQEIKNMRKKEKRNSNKHNSEVKKNISNDNRTPEYSTSEDNVLKDNRYIVNKFKQEKKRNAYINSNKKQKRKNKFEKWNMKGEFGENYKGILTPDELVTKHPDQKFSFTDKSDKNNIDASNIPFACISDDSEKCGKNLDKEKVKRNDDKEHGVNWFERRAMFRNEARKKYYEQFGESSPNNSSWYFRRMRKREQCRVKGDNSTFRKIRKENKHSKMKH